jgi:hypothetical protein
MITPLKKNFDYMLRLLLLGVVIAIGYQWGWASLSQSTSSHQQPIINTKSSQPSNSQTPSPQTTKFKSANDSTPFLTIDLSTQQISITEQRQYPINVHVTTNSQQSILWQHQPIAGISISINKNKLLLTVDDISFNELPLKLIFYNDEVSVEKTIILSNLRQPTTVNADAMTSSQDVMMTSHLSGTIVFDRLSFIESTSDNITSYRFDPNYPQQHPLRFMTVNLRDINDNITASTYTDALGRYEFDINHYSQSADYYLEVVSKMMLTSALGSRSFAQVINQGAAYPERTTYRRLYHATSSHFRLLADDNQQDMRLKTGWHSTLEDFEHQYSTAQPFAILDTLAKGFLYLYDNDIDLPQQKYMLTVHWSQDPDIVEESTGYYNSTNNLIYISGNNALDTLQKPISTISEWNEHTILHEFGHYYLKKIVGRDDTQAGKHTAFGFGTLTLALSEGLANSLSKTILEDWQYKRVNVDMTKKQVATNAQAIARDEVGNAQRYLTNKDGEGYQRPHFDFSPFIEETISYFILSIIDPRSEYSARTSKLHNEIGMQGLHQALLKSVDSPALLTVYSLAHALKLEYPAQRFAIDELGTQLDLSFNDEWGVDQIPLTSHIIGRNEELLPEHVQYPLYLPVHIGQRNAISFNGALQSLSEKRPGTLRYLTFTAPKNGRIIIRIPNVTDDDDTHQFSFNIVEQGEIIAGSRYSEDNALTYSHFNAQQDTLYIIRVFDELFGESSRGNNIKSEQTVTTNLTVEYR